MTKSHVGYEIMSTFSLALSFGAAKERAFTTHCASKKDVVNSVTTEILYLHDGMNAIVERNKTGTPAEYIYGPTGIIAIKTPSSMFYVLKDHLGSTRVVINTTEPPYALTTYDYSAFGTILTTPSSSAYLYTGQEWDQTSGLHNFKARMFDSEKGRFYGDDPAGQFTSGYIGLGNSPVNGKDPSGTLFGIDDAFIWGAIVVGNAIYGGIKGHESGGGPGAISGAFGAGTKAGVVSGFTLGAGSIAGVPGAALTNGVVNVTFTAMDGRTSESQLGIAALTGVAQGIIQGSGVFGLAASPGATGVGALARNVGAQAIATSSRSILDNASSGRGLLSRVDVGIGPLTIPVGNKVSGKDWLDANIVSIAANGLATLNSGIQGKFPKFDWQSLSLYSTGGPIGWLMSEKEIFGKTIPGTRAFTPYGMFFASEVNAYISEERFHLWQSRLWGRKWLLNFFLMFPEAVRNGAKRDIDFWHKNFFEWQYQDGWNFKD